MEKRTIVYVTIFDEGWKQTKFWADEVSIFKKDGKAFIRYKGRDYECQESYDDLYSQKYETIRF